MAAASFVPWDSAHRLTLGLTVAAAAAMWLAREQLRTCDHRRARRLIAVALLSNELLSWLISAMKGHARVPLQLCDVSALLTVWVLWSAPQADREARRSASSLAAELAYFWGLAGSLQAILTPDIRGSFPSYWWVKFFISHCSVLLGAVYLVLSGRITPDMRSVWRVFFVTNLYAALTGLLNWRFGTNYGYLAHKPAHPSLLDALGPWPWYLFGMEVVMCVSLTICYAPFALSRRVTRQRA